MRRIGPIAVFVACAACAHGESFEGGVFEKGSLRVGFGPVPASWRRVAIPGADLAFRDDERDGSALFDVHCGEGGQDAPLSILTENLVMGTTARDVERQDVIVFDEREAMHTVLRAKLDGVAMQYDVYVMKKDGCVYDLVYVAPPERFSSGSGDFERFVRGLHAPPSSPAAERTGALPSSPGAERTGALPSSPGAERTGALPSRDP